MSKIYLISPPKIDDIHIFTKQIEEIFALPEKPEIFQLRLKDTKKSYIEKVISQIKPLCIHNNIKLVLNDDIELALKHNVGVHIGEGALLEDIRKFKKQSNKIVGVSCYNNITRAVMFCEYVDYISFGSMFSTTTKLNVQHCNQGIIKQFYQMSNTKIAVIGGITPDNLSELSDILPFIRYICVISYVFSITKPANGRIIETFQTLPTL